MDRTQILEDLRSWLMDCEAFADEVTPADVLEKLDELEKLWTIDPNVCPGCEGPLDEDLCFVAYDHIWCDVKGMGIETNLELYK